MYRRVTPSLVEEATSTVQMVKVIFIWLAAPEVQIADLEVAPEVTGAVPVRLDVMLGPSGIVGQPPHGVVLVQIFRVLGNELHGLRPQRGDGLRSIVQVNREAVGFVVILHISEDIVIHVAEEVYVGLYAPVILHVCEGRVLVEEPTVPPTHLVIGYQAAVLDLLLLEHLARFLEESVVDPGGDGPVLFGDQL